MRVNFNLPKLDFSSFKRGGGAGGAKKKTSGGEHKPVKIGEGLTSQQKIIYGCTAAGVVLAIAVVAITLSLSGDKKSEEEATTDDIQEEYVSDAEYEEPKAEVRNMLTDETINGVKLEEPENTYTAQPVEQVSYVSTNTPYVNDDAIDDIVTTDVIATPVPTVVPISTPTPTPAPDPATCSHVWENADTVPATCTEEGSVTAVCKKCGKELTVKLPKVAHTWGDAEEVKAPTCTKEGQSQQTCTVCGQKKTSTIAAKGHSWGDWEVTTDPTCDKRGVETRTCKVCKEKETRQTSKKEHEPFVYTTISPTCEEEGEQESICQLCGKVLAVKVLEPLGHDFKEATRHDPTCESDGFIYYECQRKGCEASKTKTLAKLGHNYEKVFTEPTCKATGSIGKKCSNCGATSPTDWSTINTSSGLPVILEQHEWTVARKQTATEPGRITCKVCGKSMTIPRGSKVEGKTYEPGQHFDASCNQIGWTYYKCNENTSIDEEGHGNYDYAVLDSSWMPRHTPAAEKDIIKFPTSDSWGYCLTYCSKCNAVLKVDVLKE